jgi:hypothetical protein
MSLLHRSWKIVLQRHLRATMTPTSGLPRTRAAHEVTAYTSNGSPKKAASCRSPGRTMTPTLSNSTFDDEAHRPAAQRPESAKPGADGRSLIAGCATGTLRLKKSAPLGSARITCGGTLLEGDRDRHRVVLITNKSGGRREHKRVRLLDFPGLLIVAGIASGCTAGAGRADAPDATEDIGLTSHDGSSDVSSVHDAAVDFAPCDDGTGADDCCPSGSSSGGACVTSPMECWTPCQFSESDATDAFHSAMTCIDGYWVAGHGLFPCYRVDGG